MRTESDSGVAYADRHDDHDAATCPLTPLFGHEVFRRAYFQLAAEEASHPERIAELILDLFLVREIEVPDAVRDRLTACRDLDQLRAWVDRALDATDFADLFMPEQPA
ncbi:hypothetical protein ACH40E_23245 [Streptomyces acidicola]|uniref:hypothetical protein n=1 Tax=Streptomyces acidicola TaxID=2596892 RepID=UPI0037AC71EF